MSSSTSGSSFRRFLLLLACFLSALFLIDRGLYLAIRAGEQRYYGKSDFELRLGNYLKGRSFNTLIFGTSRAYEGIIPKRIAPCLHQKMFKETFQGKGPKYNFYFYQLYKKHAGIPRVVVYAVDYFVYAIESDPRWMSRFDLADKTDPPRLWAAPLLLTRFKKHNDIFCNNLITDLPRILSISRPQDDDLFDAINGYPGAAKMPGIDNSRLVIQQPPEYHHQRMPMPPGREGAYLLDLLKEWKDDGVRVALVSLPDYIGTYPTNLEMDRFHDHLRELARRFPNLTLLIYNSPQQFDLEETSYFMDGGWGKTNSHLSRLGASRLAKKLCQDLAPLYD